MPQLYTCYKITNTVNDRAYVGITSRPLLTRWKEHIQESTIPKELRSTRCELYDDIAELGLDNFLLVALEENITEDQRDDKERYYISENNALESQGGYNLASGGVLGFTHSDRSRKIMSDRSPNSGVPMSNDRKQQISAKLSGEGNPMYGKLGSDHPAYGTRRTPEQIEAVSGENSWLYGLTGEQHPSYGKKRSESFVIKCRDNATGAANPMFGKKGEAAPRWGTGKSVGRFDADDSTMLLGSYNNVREAAEWVRGNVSTKGKSVMTAHNEIYKALNGQRTIAYGYLWKYI